METLNPKSEVYSLLTQIPEGRVTTYKALAKALGDQKAARAIGIILNKNTELEKYPCFKVVRNDGKVGGYKLGKGEKIRRLKREGIEVEEGEIKDFYGIFFTDFDSKKVLKELRKEQRANFERLSLEEMQKEPRKVAGVDVAYDDGKAFATALVMNERFEIVEECRVKTEVGFPYIPTYFYYREGPVVSKAIGKIGENFDLLFLGSNGILHPRGAGLASCIGLEFEKPTIGVTKGLLCGEVKGEVGQKGFSEILLENNHVGYAYKSRKDFNPIYISPGNLITSGQALFYTKKFIKDHKMPEPIHRAHIKASEFCKNGS